MNEHDTWSETSRWDRQEVERFQIAGQALLSAIGAQLDAVAEATGPSDCQNDAVRTAVQAYDAAYTALTGENLLAPHNAEDEEGPVMDSGNGGLFSVLSRTDYLVDDFDEIIEEGRSSYRSIYPEATEDEVSAEVGDVNSAIYEILHVNEDSVPFPFPAAKPITGMTWFLEIREAMPVALNHWPQNPFQVSEGADDGLLYSHRYIYAPEPQEGG
ncbi:hypothetical protein AB0I81_07220 [Nonomuraea sp. NPDC050404]|uniref:hypothetical protein n=1 Tax=Nonomuraea sp. NPDC050404 TaxID=3155783 RepID=UPI0033E5A008